MTKKIRLTIFYADEEVYKIVKGSGVNTKMVSWANEFYKRYDYELDIFPVPYSKNFYEETFILKEKDGTTIPFHFLEGIGTLEAKSEALSRQIIKLRRERRITDVPVNQQIGIESLLREYRNQVLQKCSLLRIECHNKFRDDFPIKNPARLVVIYCRSEQPQYSLSGGTIHDAGGWLPFIIIPIIAGKDDYSNLQMLLNKAYNCLAHEIVHGAGHMHPSRGGLYDGAKNSIMNYNNVDLLPQNVILERPDQARMEHAYFVT